MMDHEPPRLWRSKAGIALAGFLVIAGFFLIIEHTAHVLGALLWLLLAACPSMRLFVHHGHGTHDHGASQAVKRENASSGSRELL